MIFSIRNNAIGIAFVVFTVIIGIAGLLCYQSTETKEIDMIHSYGIMEDEKDLSVDLKLGRYCIIRSYKNNFDENISIMVEEDSDLEFEIAEYENLKDVIIFSTITITLVFFIIGMAKLEPKINL